MGRDHARTNNEVSWKDKTDWQVANGDDFFMCLFYYIDNTTGYHGIYDKDSHSASTSPRSSYRFVKGSGHKFQFDFGQFDSDDPVYDDNITMVGATTMVANKWYVMMMRRNAGVDFTIYVQEFPNNIVQDANTADTTSNGGGFTAAIELRTKGGAFSSLSPDGKLCEFTLSRGSGAYPSVNQMNAIAHGIPAFIAMHNDALKLYSPNWGWSTTVDEYNFANTANLGVLGGTVKPPKSIHAPIEPLENYF